MIRFETIATTDGFAALKPCWDRLAAAGGAVHMFQNFDWPWRAWTCMGCHSGATLNILVGRVDGAVVLIWPLVRHRRGLRFVSTDMTEYHDVVVAPSPAGDAWMDAAWTVLRRTSGVDVVYFHDVLADSHLARLLARHGPANYRMERHSWVVRLDGWDWHGYFATRGAALRADQRRQWKRLAELPGPAAYHEITSLAGALASVDWFFAHKLAWLEARGMRAGVFGSAPHRAFVRAMVADGHAAGTLISGQLRAGATILSAGYGFAAGDGFMFYQFAYDRAYARLSPSRLLLERLMQACFRRGLRRFDFLPGDMAYKGLWATERPAIADHFLALTAVGRLKLHLNARLIGGMAKRTWLVRQYRRLPARLRHAIRWKFLPNIDYSADIRSSPAASDADAIKDAAPGADAIQDAAARPPR